MTVQHNPDVGRLTRSTSQMVECVARDEVDGVWRCRYCRCHVQPPSMWDRRGWEEGSGPGGQMLAFGADPRYWPMPQRDHVAPRARGGSNAIENIVVTCPGCNARKGQKPLADLGADWHLWRSGGDVEHRRAIEERKRRLRDDAVLRWARTILVERGITLDEWIDPNGATA